METEELLCSPGINSLNGSLNPMCHLLALLGAHHILQVGRISVNRHVQTKKLTKTLLLRDTGSLKEGRSVTGP